MPACHSHTGDTHVVATMFGLHNRQFPEWGIGLCFRRIDRLVEDFRAVAPFRLGGLAFPVRFCLGIALPRVH